MFQAQGHNPDTGVRWGGVLEEGLKYRENRRDSFTDSSQSYVSEVQTSSFCLPWRGTGKGVYTHTRPQFACGVAYF